MAAATATKTRKRKKINKRLGNKSQAIRDYLSVHPDAGPTEVVAAMSANGIECGLAHVSNIKARLRQGPIGKRGRPVKSSSNNGSAIVGDLAPGLDLLIEAKRLVSRLGGFDRTINLFNALRRLAT